MEGHNLIETHFCWKQKVKFDNEPTERYITIHGDPMLYEYPFDYQYATVEAAREGLKDAIETELIGEEEAAELTLVKVTVEPVSLP